MSPEQKICVNPLWETTGSSAGAQYLLAINITVHLTPDTLLFKLSHSTLQDLDCTVPLAGRYLTFQRYRQWQWHGGNRWGWAMSISEVDLVVI